MTTKTYLAGALVAAMALTAMAADAQGKNRGGPDRASFSELDADSNGEVTMAEMQAWGDARFAEADTDGDGGLSAEEMLAAREGAAVERLERGIARFIERADDNGNGLIEQGEMGPSEDRASARFERLDTDGSGGLSEAEFDAAREARRDHRGGFFGGPRSDRG